jgi:small subunit ribosomal protein S20
MPQHKSNEKRLRTAKKQNAYNRAIKRGLQTYTKKFYAAEGETTEASFREAVSELDLAARKGVIPKARANRKKSRLAKALARKK